MLAIDAMAAKGSQQNRDEIGKRRTIELVRSEQGEDFSESQDCNRRYPQFDTRIDVGIRADAICVRSIVSQRCCSSCCSSCCSRVGQVFEVPPNHHTKVGKVGQVPIFIGLFAGLKLANLDNFTRSRRIFGAPSRLSILSSLRDLP